MYFNGACNSLVPPSKTQFLVPNTLNAPFAARKMNADAKKMLATSTGLSLFAIANF